MAGEKRDGEHNVSADVRANTKQKRSQKPTNAEKRRRIHTAYKLLVTGKRTGEICSILMEEYKVSIATAQRYVREAGKRFDEVAAKERAQMVENSITRLALLFEEALRLRDLRTALSVQQEMNKLFGLYAPQKREITGADGGPIVVRWANEGAGDDQSE